MPATQFPLRSTAGRYGERLRRARWVILALLLAGAVSVVVFSTVFTLASSWTSLHVAGVVGVGFVTIAWGVLLLTFTPAPERLEVDAVGVRLVYPSARTKSVQWNDPKLRLIVSRTDGAPDARPGRTPLATVSSGPGFQSFIPRAAYDCIVEEARQQRLSISEQTYRRPGWSDILIQPGR